MVYVVFGVVVDGLVVVDRRQGSDIGGCGLLLIVAVSCCRRLLESQLCTFFLIG